MNKFSYLLLATIILLSTQSACVTTKKSKQEVGFIGKKYHDLTARYNGYFNAKELYKKNLEIIEEQHIDNYAQLLPIYTYDAEFDRSTVEADMNKAIEKTVKVSALHEPSKWVDDCYVLMGKAQYIKGDLETAQETFEYFVADFNPRDPDSRVYITPDIKETAKDRKKKADDARKIQQEEREKAKKEKEKERKQKKKERDQKAKDRKNRSREERIAAAKQKVEATKEKITDAIGNTAPPENDIVASTSEVAFDPDEEYIASFENKPVQKGPTELQTNEGGFLKHKPAYQEGVYWLSRTYIARELWLEANYYLDKLEKEETLSDELREATLIARADYYLGQKDYINAIPALRKAIDESSDKKIKSRMAFILAQSYQLKGLSAEAFAAFEEVQKYKPSFAMSLNAELNQIKNAWASGNKSEDGAIKELGKMAKEGKYEAHRGSIYSTMAEIKLASGDQEAALSYFNLALNSGGSTDKTEIYYRLATLFYSKDQYIAAKTYYDSTAIVMAQKDRRRPEVEQRASSLTTISQNMRILQEKDSLLALSAMTEEALDEYAKKVASKALDEVIAQAKEENSSGFTATTSVVSSNSNFFAYNEISRQKGYQEFIRKWGDRSLEDNWRRSSRAGGANTSSDDPSAIVESYSLEDLEREMNKVKRDIPRTPEEIEKVKVSRATALFNLGTGYRNLIQKYDKSVTTLEQLLAEYPETEKRAETYFYLYLNYVDLNDKVKSNTYFNKLMEEFPTSDYAQYLKNPNAKDGLMTDKRKVEVYYDQTYELFSSGNFDEAYSRLDQSTELFKENHMIAKYDLLKAMVIGKLKGQDEYLNALRGVILKYNNTPEQTYAKELMRFLKGDGEAFGAEVSDADMSKFSLEFDRMHYVIMIVYDSNSSAVDEIENKIEAYNDLYFKDKRLRQASISLNQEAKSHLILIRRFNNKDDAMIYYHKTTKDGSKYVDSEKNSYELFAINQKNYREVIQQKNANSYRLFFEENYLKDNK